MKNTQKQQQHRGGYSQRSGNQGGHDPRPQGGYPGTYDPRGRQSSQQSESWQGQRMQGASGYERGNDDSDRYSDLESDYGVGGVYESMSGEDRYPGSYGAGQPPRHASGAWNDQNSGRRDMNATGREGTYGGLYNPYGWQEDPRGQNGRFGQRAQGPDTQPWRGQGSGRSGQGMQGSNFDRSRENDWRGGNVEHHYGGGERGFHSSDFERSTRFNAPKGYTRSDDRIREDVCDALGHDGRFDPSEIEVTVKAGEVTLTGTIDRLGSKHAIESLVHGVAGVKDVTSNIRLKRETSATSGTERSERDESENGGRQQRSGVRQTDNLRHS